MTTGDIQGNLERLRAQLRSVGYPNPVDIQGLKLGLPSASLPLLHHALLGYSRHVARYLSTNGYELYAKSDLRFMECMLKFLRTEFGYRCPLTLAQIFSRGFSERKILFVHDVIQCCKRKHNEQLKLSRRTSPLKKIGSNSASFGKHRKPQRSIDLRDEDYDIASSKSKAYDMKVKSYGIPFPKSKACENQVQAFDVPSPRTKVNEQGERLCKISVDGPDFRFSGHLLSPRARVQCQSSGLKLDLSEDQNVSRSPEPRSPRSVDGEESMERMKTNSPHFARILIKGNTSAPLPGYAEVDKLSPKHIPSVPFIDASLPRKLDSTVPRNMDASLPRKLAPHRSPRKSDSSPRRMDSASPMKLEPISPREAYLMPPRRLDQTSPKQFAQTSPKASPRRLDRACPTHREETVPRTSCYDEIKQKIGEIAEKLESRFGSLEHALTKTTKNIEARFNTLESRVRLLEKAFPSQASHYADAAIYQCKKHSPKRQNHNYNFLLDDKSHSPRKYDETRLPSPAHVIRDISNVHRDYPQYLSCGGVHSELPPPGCVYTHSQLRGNLSTQELIESIKARCSRTKELLDESRHFP